MVAHDTKVLASAAYDKALRMFVEAARHDPASFCEFVLKDEATGRHVKLAPVHEAWHEALTGHDRLILWAHVEAGKTNQISIGRVLWELGKNPGLRIVVLSNTNEQAKKIVRAIAQYITKSERLHMVFPHLRKARDPSLPWTANAITVERDNIAKDPSVQAAGLGGNIIGARIDLLVLDDVLDYENTRTMDRMAGVLSWLKATAIGRLTDASRVWGVTNAWHPKDPMHALAAEPRYKGMSFPVVSPAGVLSWPAKWSRARIERSRQDLGPLEFGRQLLCQARDDDAARFKREWLDVGLVAGRGYKFVHEVDVLPEGYALFTGVDLAVQQHDAADLSVFFTILLHLDTWQRQVLNIESGRWSGPEIVRRIDDHAVRYNGIIVVENVGAQDYILQFARKATRGTLRAFTTGKNKANPVFGVESMAAELAGGGWIIPNLNGKLDKETDAWVNDMLYYNPKSHTGDRLMASWFAREGARAFERTVRREVSTGVPGYSDGFRAGVA